ncbi:hypothetical protein FOC84_07210 [Achromobacter pestifer]|uniref:Uncharacterized protein n=1 Tax=Achromobacter pestifer TaxID=1353889 RepID=A0A7D4E2Y5_9BURK|nr:hypothetical protein [Achromobacter pestifer]QKH34746.1 hypothetical protein FOC84_07210 [Achromobacter pestifer]
MPAVLALSAILTNGDASANENAWGANLEYSNMSNGYSNCTYQDNGNGTSTVGVTISYKSAWGHLGNRPFRSRGVLVYTYDKNGNLQNSDILARDVYMDGTRHTGMSSNRSFGVFYNVTMGRPFASWHVTNAQTVRVLVNIDNKFLTQWPAIGVRAGNVSQVNIYAEITGLAYIGVNNSSGNCNVITEPEIPPPPVDAKITMSAPDWDLGELPQGTATRTPFHGVGDQLCFTYDNLKWTGLRYAINATNQNGLSGNGSYQLRHLTSPADTVPYRVVLQDATTNTEVALPNTSNAVSALGNNGRDCFFPTFTADTPKAAKEGDYSDVLTFTVVARP